MTRKQVTQYPREDCYFCGSDGPIESHHIVPRRFGGIDDPTNLVDLCSSCHRKLEQLYGKRFYHRVGADRTENEYLPKTVLEDIAKIQFDVSMDDGIETFESRKVFLSRLVDEFNLDEVVCRGCHLIATPAVEKDGTEMCKHCGTSIV